MDRLLLTTLRPHLYRHATPDFIRLPPTCFFLPPLALTPYHLPPQLPGKQQPLSGFRLRFAPWFGLRIKSQSMNVKKDRV